MQPGEIHIKEVSNSNIFSKQTNKVQPFGKRQMAPAPIAFQDQLLTESYISQIDKSTIKFKVRRQDQESEIDGAEEPVLEQLSINSQTWDRECHGLYDYDLKEFFATNNIDWVGCGYI